MEASNTVKLLEERLARAEAQLAEKAKLEAVARESDTRHRLLLGTWAQAVWETDAAGVVTADSPSWRAYTGQSLDEWLGYGWLDAIHSDDRAYAERQWRDAMAARSLVNAEFRLRAPDGGWRWTNVRAAPVLDAAGKIEKWAGINIDIDARKRAEEALRDSEARYRNLFETMRQGYLENELIRDADGRAVDYRTEAVNPQFERLTGIAAGEAVGRTARELIKELDPVWIETYDRVIQTGEPEQFEREEPAFGRWFEVQAYPLVGDRFAILYDDITERKRAEAVLRESEERFQQFANASASGLWIRDAETLSMEFASPAIATVFGTAPDAFIGGIERWAATIVPEDRVAALNHIKQARDGEPVIHEFRIRRSDGSFRWVRNTDFALHDEKGNVERIGGIAEDVTETKMAIEHQGVLLAELQHRVRNIMAVIRSTVVRSADGAVDVEDYRTSLAGRLLALARVQTLLTRQANAGGSLRGILESEIAAQAHSENQYELTGPDLMLSPKAVEVLTLAIHELSTNALKYGALSVSGGKISVTWTPFEKRERSWVAIDWVEEGSPSRPPPIRRGFGLELIEAKIPYELRGTGKTTIGPSGAHCHIEFPLREAESVLETDAPAPTRLSGGIIDMTGAPDLTGKIVLVVEDDYYVASDTAAALRGAGAVVLGPCATEEDVLRLLEIETPNAAVLDLNLGGGGPRFVIAHKLVERGTPFVFLTGYDPNVIPDEMADVVRLEKPIAFHEIVEAVSNL